MTAIEIRIVKDYDGKWTSRWPPALVAAGRSPGAGRHETKTRLLAAIRAAGWEITPHGGDRWTAQKVAA